MAKRSTPQAQVDDRAFPVRLLIRAPEFGLGVDLDLIYRWLDQSAGRGEYALHGAGRATGGGDVVGVYFRHPEVGARFLAVFPHLRLADGTEAPTYTSPALPFGRKERGSPPG